MTSIQILVVDDELTNRKLLQLLLENEGYVVILATNGREALEILEVESIDLILLDLMMPEVDGFQVLRTLGERGLLPALPVVLLTGFDERGIRLEALRSGAIDFVTKPFDRTELLCRIKTLVELKRLRQDSLQKVQQETENEVSARVGQALNGLPILLFGAHMMQGKLHTDWVLGEVSSLLGIELPEFLSGDWLDKVHHDDRAKLQIPTKAGLKQDGNTWDYQYRWLHPVKGERWFLAVGRFDPGQNRLFGAQLDITETKELEQKYHQAQKMEAIGQLAGGIAHDFNNLLSVILSFTSFVKSTLPEQSAESEDLEEVLKASKRAAGLTRQLLTFSRRQPSAEEPTDLNLRLAQLNRLLVRSVGEHIRLELVPSVHQAVVLIDPVQFDQVLLNLAVNARDAMPESGSLTIALRRNTSESVELRVKDTGSGMDPETQRRIFEPFFTTKSSDSGTGLGLATCKAIVEKAGGTVEVESQAGKGTTFVVTLPSTTLAPVAEVVEVETRTIAGLEILVVEDEPALLKAVSRTLSKAGYVVHTAIDLPHAQAKLEAVGNRLHALVTDLVIPGGTGVQLADYAKNMNPALAVLLTTGYYDKTIDLKENGYQLLWKPVQPDKLLRALAGVIGPVADENLVRREESQFSPTEEEPKAEIGEKQLSRLRNRLLAAHHGGDIFFKNTSRTAKAFSSALSKIHMYYQPIVRSSDGSIFGFEAFMRCKDAEFQSPMRLFAAAEVLDRVDELGRVVRTSIANDLSEYRERVEVIFVNLHPSELSSANLCHYEEHLQHFASRVVLELSEIASLSSGPEIRSEIGKIKEMGYRLAVGDLGDGYSGLLNMMSLQPDFLKFDMSLVHGIDQAPLKVDIIAAIIDLAASAGIMTVAEGVERPAERDVLVSLGCNLLQGYCFAKPGPAFPQTDYEAREILTRK